MDFRRQSIGNCQNLRFIIRWMDGYMLNQDGRMKMIKKRGEHMMGTASVESRWRYIVSAHIILYIVSAGFFRLKF